MLSAYLIGLGLHRSYVRARNPELLAVRKRMGAGTKRWDVRLVGLFWLAEQRHAF